jgi:D-sedoheptulose 7-phosphate isomerase
MNEESISSAARNLITASLQEHISTIRSVNEATLPAVLQGADLLWQTLAGNKKVLLCGNGGSAADAQHIAAELVGRYEQPRRPFPAIALTTDSSALTALSNDYGYEDVFARQVKALAVEGDLLIAISTSGRSENVLRAAHTAREIGCRTIALTGRPGEPLVSECDVQIVVASDRTSRVQEAHILIGHLWCEYIDMRCLNPS